MAMAAAAVTRSARPRISATMIWLPSPFILRKGTVLTVGLADAVGVALCALYGGSRRKLPVLGKMLTYALTRL